MNRMNKIIYTLTTVLIICTIVTGCTHVKHKPAEATKTKPETPETQKTILPKPQPSSATSFHDKFAEILKKFVNNEGMVNYSSLKLKRSELKQLLGEFSRLDPNEYNRWLKEDKIAFWINAYNMHTLNIILNNYPIKAPRILSIIWGPYSIRHINKQIKGIDKQKFTVMKEVFTLTEIEQRFFRKQFNEPKVFFALAHACLSSPPLRNEPYYGHKLNEQLDDQIRKFLANPLAFKLDKVKQTVYLSPIFEADWYGAEFIEKYVTDKKFKDQPLSVRAVLNLIIDYVSKQDASFLELESYSIKYLNYNWTINEYPKHGSW